MADSQASKLPIPALAETANTTKKQVERWGGWEEQIDLVFGLVLELVRFPVAELLEVLIFGIILYYIVILVVMLK